MAGLRPVDPVDTPEALLQAVRIPGQVVVHHQVGALQIDALAGRVRCDRRLHPPVVQERLWGLTAFFPADTPMDDRDGVGPTEEGSDPPLQVVGGVPVLGERRRLLARRADGRRRGALRRPAVTRRRPRRSSTISPAPRLPGAARRGGTGPPPRPPVNQGECVRAAPFDGDGGEVERDAAHRGGRPEVFELQAAVIRSNAPGTRRPKPPALAFRRRKPRGRRGGRIAPARRSLPGARSPTVAGRSLEEAGLFMRLGERQAHDLRPGPDERIAGQGLRGAAPALGDRVEAAGELAGGPGDPAEPADEARGGGLAPRFEGADELMDGFPGGQPRVRGRVPVRGKLPGLQQPDLPRLRCEDAGLDQPADAGVLDLGERLGGAVLARLESVLLEPRERPAAVGVEATLLLGKGLVEGLVWERGLPARIFPRRAAPLPDLVRTRRPRSQGRELRVRERLPSP